MNKEIAEYLAKHPKTGPFPLAQEFNLTMDQARKILEKPNDRQESPRVLPRRAILTKPRTAPASLNIFMTTHPVAILFIRILSAVIGVACLVRGFLLIVDYNGAGDFRSYLMPIIFQGLSFLFPILAWVEWKQKKYVAFLALALLSLSSMTYEFRVSLDGLLTASYANVQPDTNKVVEDQIKTILTQLETKKLQQSNLQLLLSKRQTEFSVLQVGDPGYYTKQGQINSILKDQGALGVGIDSLSSQLVGLQAKLTPVVKKRTVYTVLGLDENIALGVMIVFQSILIILSAPLCIGVALLFNPAAIHKRDS